MSCPFSNLNEAIPKDPAARNQMSCPFHQHKVGRGVIKSLVPVAVQHGTQYPSQAQAQLLEDIGGGDVLREFMTRFYSRFFADQLISAFIFMDDGAEAHAKRLADWVIEKMGGEGKPWTESGRYGMRQPSHHQAWNSSKRHPSVRGRHFDLVDTRIWMRLHFWAGREWGLAKHRVFWKWYIAFIAHFIAIYDGRAPRYAIESARWSKDPKNINTYLANDWAMLEFVNGRGR